MNEPTSLYCPSCRSQRVWKDGIRYGRRGKTQRYICRECGLKFSETSKPLQKPFYGSLNRTSAILLDRQVSVSEVEMRNLVEVESRTEKWAAGATEQSLEDMNGKIVEFSFWMLKKGYRESTIKMRTRQMKILVKRGANIFDPESVKEIIAMQPWKESRKAIVTNTYTCFLSMIGQKWDPPKYEGTRAIPFIPTEEEIDQLIAGCGKKTATFLQLLKETAIRAGEAHNLQWADVDVAHRTIKVAPEKRSEPRIFKVSPKMIAMLDALPKISNRVFGDVTYVTHRTTFTESRRRIAEKLQNPRILYIHFHTLRHWKATMLYHQTKDILYVMRFLGHKNIKNTLLYVQLAEAIFKDASDEFTCRVAKTPKEMAELIEAGFEYVTDMNELKFFRKRK